MIVISILLNPWQV